MRVRVRVRENEGERDDKSESESETPSGVSSLGVAVTESALVSYTSSTVSSAYREIVPKVTH